MKNTVQTNVKTYDSELTTNLVGIANFIELRKVQKNSLSNFNQNERKKYNENEKINPLLIQLSNQLEEGHTIFSFSTTANKTSDYRQLFDSLSSKGWVTVISQDTPSKIQNITTPIVVLQTKHDNQSNSQKVYESVEYIVWLHRHWYAENLLAQQLLAIANRVVDILDSSENIDEEVTSKFNPNPNQQLAIERASCQAFSIIIGGPGTGKTFTVAQLVKRLQQAHEKKRLADNNLPPLSIALTAPTGKAAQRMQISLENILNNQKSLGDARTIHRLLGIGNDGIPRYHANNPLPDDLVIVDEASMLGLELASMLVNAIKPTGRLILLGDANQLAAVDAGSVLADLCQISVLQPFITELTESKRFDDKSKVGVLAKLIQQESQASEKISKVFELLQTIDIQDDQNDGLQNKDLIKFYDTQMQVDTPIHLKKMSQLLYQQLAKPYMPFFDLLKSWYVNPVNIHDAANRQQLFEVFDRYRILAAGRQGLLGIEAINQTMTGLYFEHSKISRLNHKEFFYHGLPIMIKNNDYQLRLFNGDIGICILYDKQLWACFSDQVIAIHRLSLESCERAYAMTIHKSQGSEFDEVAICIDKAHTRLLSQELIYTAVTRSKTELSIYSQADILQTAITQKGVRQTGLQLQFEQIANG